MKYGSKKSVLYTTIYERRASIEWIGNGNGKDCDLVILIDMASSEICLICFLLTFHGGLFLEEIHLESVKMS